MKFMKLWYVVCGRVYVRLYRSKGLIYLACLDCVLWMVVCVVECVEMNGLHGIMYVEDLAV